MFLLFVTVAILSLYKSTVNWRSRKVEGNFTHKVNYRLRSFTLLE